MRVTRTGEKTDFDRNSRQRKWQEIRCRCGFVFSSVLFLLFSFLAKKTKKRKTIFVFLFTIGCSITHKDAGNSALSLMRNQCACNQTYHNFFFSSYFFVSMMNVSKFPNSRIDCPKSVFFFFPNESHVTTRRNRLENTTNKLFVIEYQKHIEYIVSFFSLSLLLRLIAVTRVFL